MNKFYLAIEHAETNDADYYQFNTMFAAINFVITNDIVDWTMCDRPFYQESDGQKTEVTELVAQTFYTVIHA